MALPALPTELLFIIAENINPLKDLNSLSRTNKLFHLLCNPILYKTEITQQKPEPCSGCDCPDCFYRSGGKDKDNWKPMPTTRFCKPVKGWGKAAEVHNLFIRTQFQFRASPFRTLIRIQCRDTAFDWAIENDRPETVTRLLAYGASVETKLLGRGSTKWYAAEFSDPTPLITAVSLEKINTVKALLKMGADANATVEGGGTALHAAVMKYACGGILPKSAHLVRLLLDAGADVEALSSISLRKRPLAVAANAKNIPAMRILLAYGADIEFNSIWGKVLDGAVMTHRWEAVRLLLESGAQVERVENEFDNQLYRAICAGCSVDMFKTLMEYGADVLHGR
ncbi:ankyrin repeat-containing domain protein [Trichophaea hybrida]|nr:ankyrin repeat-containing domain protein [Trichophaea hybrida]